MKLAASDANARTDSAPYLRQFDFRQLSSGVIPESLVRHTDGSSQHLVCQPKRLQRANAVSGDIQAGTTRRPRCGPLDDVRYDPLLLQRPAESKPRETTTDNQNP